MQSYEAINDAAMLAHGYTHDAEIGAECILVPMTKKQLGLLTQAAALMGLTLWANNTPDQIKGFIQEMTFDDIEDVSTEDEFLDLVVLPLEAQPASSPLCDRPSTPDEDTADVILNGIY